MKTSSIAIPETSLLVGPSAVQFKVSEDMVAQFAALTGDSSALHLNDVFARRSPYRGRIVHGMLPVGFLCLLRPFQIDGVRSSVRRINGRFASPVYAGDSLTLTAGLGQIAAEADNVVFDYRIQRDLSGDVVTSGSVTVGYEPETEPSGESTAATSAELLVRPVEARNVRLEEIEKGTTDCLDFRVSDATIRAFINLLAEGCGTDTPAALSRLTAQCHIPNLLTLLLFSTSVGVCLPGTSATFLEFSAAADRDVAPDTTYRLRGQVTHRSAATRIVRKELLVSPVGRDDEIVVRGKVVALANRPPRQMPTMSELRDSATDSGLKGKVVLITGGSRGIGETTAKLFALSGAKVIVNYHRGADDAGRIVKEITDGGGEAVAIAADVTSPEQVRALVESGIDRYGGIHILVNNAARDYRPIPFLRLSWEEIQRDLDVIAKGAFLCCQQVIPHMLAQGGGKIVNISSVAADNPPPDQTKYVMAKSALVGLTRSLSIEFASRNIQVNLVVPNFVETDLVAHVQEGFRRKIAQDIPMQRHGTPIEVAQAVLFLASSHSSFTTGQKILVTGGGAPYV